MIKKIILVVSATIFSIGLLGCSDDDGTMNLKYSKEGMGKSELEMAAERSRREALKQRSNALPPPREDGQHDIIFPSWIGGAEKQEYGEQK